MSSQCTVQMLCLVYFSIHKFSDTDALLAYVQSVYSSNAVSGTFQYLKVFIYWYSASLCAVSVQFKCSVWYISVFISFHILMLCWLMCSQCTVQMQCLVYFSKSFQILIHCYPVCSRYTVQMQCLVYFSKSFQILMYCYPMCSQCTVQTQCLVCFRFWRWNVNFAWMLHTVLHRHKLLFMT